MIPLIERYLGQIISVENTPNDFRKLTRIDDHIHEIPYAYNVMFVVDGEGKRSFGKWVESDQSFSYVFSIRLVHTESGRAMSVESTQKGLQFYTGTYLDNVKGRRGAIYNKYSGLCLETQNYTDSVNNQVNELQRMISIMHRSF